MSEKSLLLYESATGKKVAIRDAYELDDISEARYIEEIDLVSKKFNSPIGYPKRGGVYTKAYTSGGTHQIIAGDILTGATSGYTCRVISLTLTGGSWAGGDAAGTLTVVDKSGVFVAENLNYESVDTCTIAAGDLAASTLIAADTFDLTALPAELTQNLINCGDTSVLVVSVEQYTTGGTAVITPIIYDKEASPNIVGVLPSKTFTQTYAFRRGSGSGSYCLPFQMWDIHGAHKIGLHLSAITGTSNYVYVRGWCL